MKPWLADVLEDAENELPVEGRALLRKLGDEFRGLDERVATFDAQLSGVARRTPSCRRLMGIPGVGVLTATALVATVGDAGEFRSGREISAWLGLVPQQRSMGGRPMLLGISKRGDRYLRTLLIHGARAVLRVGFGAPTGAAGGRWQRGTTVIYGRHMEDPLRQVDSYSSGPSSLQGCTLDYPQGGA